MSITSNIYPSTLKVAFAREKLPLKFTSSDSVLTAGAYAIFSIQWSYNPGIDEFLNIQYDCGEHIELNFIFKPTPDDSGLQLPLWNGTDTLTQYATKIIAAIWSNYYIQRDFTSNQNVGLIYFNSIISGLKTPVVTYSGSAGLSHTIINNGANFSQKENYKILCRTYLASGNLLLGEDLISCNAQGVGNLDISEYVNSQLQPSFTYPIDGTLIREMPFFVREFYCKIANYWGNPATAQIMTTLALFKAISGGVGKSFQAIFNGTGDTLYDFLAPNKFLTWHPTYKLVDNNQPERLYFLNFSTATQIRLQVKLYYTDDSTTSFTAYGLSSTSQHKVYEITVTPNQLIANQVLTPVPGHYIYKIEVWLEDQDFVQISEKRMYHLNAFEARNRRYVVFKNSPGGYDTLQCAGIGSFGTAYDRMVGEATLPENYTSTAASVQDFYIGQVQKMKLNSGLFRIENEDGRQWAEYLQELLLSKEVYEYTIEGIFRLKVLTNEIVLAVDDNNLYSAEIEVQRTYVDTLFSPLTSQGTTLNQSFFGEGFGTGFEVDPGMQESAPLGG